MSTAIARKWNLKERPTVYGPALPPPKTSNRVKFNYIVTTKLNDETTKTLLSGARATGGELIYSNYSLCHRLVQGFRDIRCLADGWNGYSAPAPTEQTITEAENISQVFPQELQPEIQPESDGSVGLYWEELGVSACIKVKGNGGSWAIETEEGKVNDGQSSISLGDVAKALLTEFKNRKISRYAYWANIY